MSVTKCCPHGSINGLAMLKPINRGCVLTDRQAHLTNHVIRSAKTSPKLGGFVEFSVYTIRNFLFVGKPEVMGAAIRYALS